MRLASSFALASIHQKFIQKLGLFPVIGIELEFYVEGESPSSFIEALKAHCFPESELLPVEALKAETGIGQYEAEFGPTLETGELQEVVERFRLFAIEQADIQGYKVRFESKPYSDQPGCGLHINVSLVDKNGQNLFMRQQNQDVPLLQYAIGGLLELLPASMQYFAPLERCYARYIKGEIIHGKKNIETPHTISWGGNNRSVAIRIPESTLQEHTRRLEHRVPSVEANIEDVLSVILLGIQYGIENKILPFISKTYGHAFEDQYQPIWLPQLLTEARQYTHQILTAHSVR